MSSLAEKIDLPPKSFTQDYRGPRLSQTFESNNNDVFTEEISNENDDSDSLIKTGEESMLVQEAAKGVENI